MRKILLIISILYLSGCASDKKKANETPDTVVDKTSISEETPPSITETQHDKKKVMADTLIQVDTTASVSKAPVLTETEEKIIQPKEMTDKKSVIKEKVTEEIKEQVVEKVRPNHTAWNQLTKKYVSSSGKVNYKGFKSNISIVDTYLTHLQEVAPEKDWTKNEKLAYWFNLYNASTVQMVANAYPIKSIRDLNNGKPWDKKFVKSGGKTYSLNEIENTIVRPNYNEPRLHVAFNCAAISCPKLSNEAFIPTKLNSQLNRLSKAWVNDPSKNKVTENSIEISKIFEWYAADFKTGSISFINKYITTKIADGAEIKYLEYNWELND